MHIVNKAKDLLNKFRYGKISRSDFKKLVSTINDSSDLELEGDLFEEWNKFNAYPSLPQEEIDTLYCNLRKKMKTADAIPEIKAVYGFGYKLITTPEA